MSAETKVEQKADWLAAMSAYVSDEMTVDRKAEYLVVKTVVWRARLMVVSTAALMVARMGDWMVVEMAAMSGDVTADWSVLYLVETWVVSMVETWVYNLEHWSVVDLAAKLAV